LLSIGPESLRVFMVIATGVACFCSYLFLVSGLRRSPLRAALLACSSTVLAFSWFGNDVVLWGACVFLPLWWYVVERTTWSASAISCCALVFVSVLLSVTANQFALLLLVIPLLTTSFEGQERRVLVSLAIAVIAAAWPLAQQAGIHIPSYPFGGHVTRSFGTKTGLWPMIGVSHAELQVVERYFLNPRVFWIGVTLGVVSLVTSVLCWKEKSQRVFFVSGILLSLSVFLDSGIAGAELTQIAPLATLARTIPGLFSMSLVPLFSALALLSLSRGIAGGTVKGMPVPTLLFGVVAIGWCLQLLPQKRGYLVREGGEKVAQKVVSNPALQPRVFSQSYPLFRDFGAGILALQGAEPEYVGYRDQIDFIIASGNQDLTDLLVDGSESTRWHPVNGQKGREWIAVQFKEQVSIEAVELSPGTFATDFPGGLEVRIAEKCPLPGEGGDNSSEVFRQHPWEGALAFTRDGYPYYTHQGKVEVRFTKAVSTSCMILKQVAPYRYFDWSVAELRFALKAGVQG
jgi:hypothetical protein